MRLLLVGFAIAAVGVVAGVVAQNMTDGEDASVSVAAAPIADCPNGEEVSTYTPGSRVFAVGRTEASDWIQIRDLASPDSRVWVRASDIDLDARAADLPVTDCPTFDGVVTAADSSTTTTTPETTTTTVDSSTTTTIDGTTTTQAPTTTEPPSTTTTEAPDNTPPQISQESAKPLEIWEQNGLGISCPLNTNRESTISANVTDDFGVTSVTASWSDPFGNQSVAMTGVGNNYSATFGPYAAGDWDPASLDPFDHLVTITITASDSTGNQSSTTVSVTVWEIGKCFI